MMTKGGGSRSDKRPVITPVKPETMRAGTITSPACSGDKPSTCCRKMGTIKSALNSPMLLKNEEAQIRRNVDCRNRCRFTTGKGVSSSRKRKRPPPARAANPSQISVEVSVLLLRLQLIARSSGTRKLPRASSPR